MATWSSRAESAVLLAVPDVELATLAELEAETADEGSTPPGPRTTMVCVVEADCPYEPIVPMTLMTCVPKSLASGVHEKSPDALMLLFVMDDVVPVNASETEKVVGQ